MIEHKLLIEHCTMLLSWQADACLQGGVFCETRVQFIKSAITVGFLDYHTQVRPLFHHGFILATSVQLANDLVRLTD